MREREIILHRGSCGKKNEEKAKEVTEQLYSDRDNIIIIIIIFIGFLGLRFKLVLRWLRWYFVGCIGISLVVIPSLNGDGK